MFTVLLFRKPDWEALQRYSFVFSNFQMDQQVVFCEWPEKAGVEAIVEELDFLTRDHYEWKLLIYGGKMRDGQEDCAQIMGRDMFRLVRIYAGKERLDEGSLGEETPRSVKGFLPVHIWYIGYREKQDCEKWDYVRGAACPSQEVDTERELGASFRMLWFEVDESSQMQEKYDLFRLSCGLLVLAINNIPGPYLECGYLYQLDVKMERRPFAGYVMRLKAHLDCIREQAMAAAQDLAADYLRQTAYPEIRLAKTDLNQKRKKLDGDGKWIKITYKDLSNASSLEAKLQGNRRWVRSRLYFPKGILKQELGRMQDQIDKAPGASALLNSAARDRADREQQAVIDRMQLRREEENLWKTFPGELEKREDKLRETQEHWRWGREKYAACAVLGTVESVLLAPLLFELLSFLGKSEWLVLLVAAVAFSLLLLAHFHIRTRLEFSESIRDYHHLLDKRLQRVQENGIRYMNDIVDMTGEYQYVLRLKTEDRLRRDLLRRRKELLERHQWVRESAEVTSRQLESLLGNEEKILEQTARPWVDFSVDPREVEYYWVPHRRKKNMAELNCTGDFVNVFFDFISGITLRKTLRKMKTGTAEGI